VGEVVSAPGVEGMAAWNVTPNTPATVASVKARVAMPKLLKPLSPEDQQIAHSFWLIPLLVFVMILLGFAMLGSCV